MTSHPVVCRWLNNWPQYRASPSFAFHHVVCRWLNNWPQYQASFPLSAMETSFFQRCSRDRSLSLVFLQHVKYRRRSCFLLMVVGEVQLCTSFIWGLLTAVYGVNLTTEPEDDLHVSWQAQHFGDSIVILRGRCSTLDVWCCVFSNLHCQGCVKWWQRAHCVEGMGYRESGLLRGKRSIWCRSVVCGMSFCVARTVFGTLCTLHFTLHTLHFTLYTPHFILHT